MSTRKRVDPIIEITEEVPWQRVAFDLWCRGHRRWEPIARTCKQLYADGKLADQPTDARSVKRAVLKELSLYRADDDKNRVDPLQEYIIGLEADLLEADRLQRNAVNESAKCGALRLKLELRTRIAAAKGVVTERKGVENSGEVGVYGLTPEALALMRKREAQDNGSQPAGD